MNRTSPANATKAVAWSRLITLLLGEGVLFGLFLILGSDPTRRVDFAHFSTWINQVSPSQAIVAFALLVGVVGAFWLFASTLLYLAARLMHLSRVSDGLGILTLPAVRRMVDGALAVSIAGTTLFGAGRMAMAAPVTHEASVVSIQANRAAPQRLNAYDFDLTKVFRATSDVPEPAGDGEQSGPAEDAVVRPSTPDANAAQDNAGVAPGAQSESPDSASEVPQPAGDAEVPADQTPTTTTAPGPATDVPDPAGNEAMPRPEVAPEVAPQAAPQVAPEAAPEASSGNNAVSRQAAPSPADDSTATPPGVSDDGTQAPAAPTTPDTPVVAGESAQVGSYTVEPGDNFWVIAQRQVEAKLGRAPSNEEVRAYWMVLIEANRGNFRSGNPNLIFPGEQFVLPPVG